MNLHGRALYNALQYNTEISTESWKTTDYRSLETNKLLEGLKKFGITLSESSFCLYAENCDSPEELTDCLWLDEEHTTKEEEAYLLIFELWRRLLPEKSCISIFCDELDYWIQAYDEDRLSDNEKLLLLLDDLENILDKHVDQGCALDEVFAGVCEYCAHHIEHFLYDFIGDLISEGDTTPASELIDGFYSYIHDKRSFDLLKAELLFESDAEEASIMLRRVLDSLKENPDSNLLFDLLYVAKSYADTSLLSEIFSEAFDMLNENEDLTTLFNFLQECLEIKVMKDQVETIQNKYLNNYLKNKSFIKEAISPFLANL